MAHIHYIKGKNTGIALCRQPDSFTLKCCAVYIHLSGIIFQIFRVFPIIVFIRHFYRTIAINCIIKNQYILIAFRHCDRDIEPRSVPALICGAFRKVHPRSVLHECPVPICIHGHIHRYTCRTLCDNVLKVACHCAARGFLLDLNTLQKGSVKAFVNKVAVIYHGKRVLTGRQGSAFFPKRKCLYRFTLCIVSCCIRKKFGIIAVYISLECGAASVGDGILHAQAVIAAIIRHRNFQRQL